MDVEFLHKRWLTLVLGLSFPAFAFASCASDDDAASGDGPVRCPPTQSACGGVCVSTSNNAANCGDCGHACSTGQICARGQCECGATQTACSSGCADVLTDPNNCGVCGKH